MGTWGYGAFENDSAADWLEELVETTDCKSLVKPIRTVVRSKRKVDLDDCLEAIAGAEILAGARYVPPRNLPRRVSSWVERVGLVPSNDDLGMAQIAVARVAKCSELEECWEATAKLKAWRRELAKLAKRLASATKAPRPRRAAKSLRQPKETLAEFIIGVSQNPTATRLDALLKKLESISNPNSLVGGMCAGQRLNRLTPLHWVASRGLIEAARVLLARGAQVDMKPDSLSGPPVVFAIEGNHLEMVGLLLEAGAAKETALMAAIAKDQPAMIGLILNHGAKVNGVGNDGWTPLGYAARLGSLKAAELLLELGADVNASGKDADGADDRETPLHHAATGRLLAEGSREASRFHSVATLLVKAGALVDRLNAQGETPLDIAKEARATSLVRLLSSPAN